MKFTVKVLHVLQFVKMFPQYRNTCGATWRSDNKHFLCHSTILANFLSIKANTINANFRSHGFKIIPMNSIDIMKEFPDLVDPRNWKMRTNFKFDFTPTSTVNEVNLIPCKQTEPKVVTVFPIQILHQNQHQEKPSNSIQKKTIISNLPPETQSLLNQDPNVFLHTELFYNKMSGTHQRRQFLISACTKEWKRVYGARSRGCLNIIVNEICMALSNTIEGKQIRNNVIYLLSNQEESATQKDEDDFNLNEQLINNSIHHPNFSPNRNFPEKCTEPNNKNPSSNENVNENMSKSVKENMNQLQHFILVDEDENDGEVADGNESVNQNVEENDILVTFCQFLNFFIRYGSISKAVDYIRELSRFSCMVSLPDFIYNHSTPSSQFENTPHFQSWFQPSFNNAVSTRILDTQPRNTWLLRPSSTPGKFTIHHKRSDYGKMRVIATHICFNTLSLNKEPAFTVSFENGEVVGASTWQSILFDIMKLSTENGLAIDVEGKSSHYVTADQLIVEQEQFQQQSQSLGLPFSFSSQSDFQIPSSQRLF
ncbi:hypothetical protein TRFO_20635 [Tritrichomonas foetus]|uniref:Initiator binding domain-containing protein n=1 Tax=Tritrichomonas foetus TaxID=1144522 RepID=A0A1J4KFD8_9EUKA|nr:hypothetical protein TRFO_20635 [Tritrichomonas foetus]|eukprot:OHT10169.1 hypothetical protein TRFO_20635 [Tritrichomonas foetus]